MGFHTVPENKVFVFDCVIPSSPHFHAFRLLALVCKLAGGEQLVILVFSNPDRTGREAGALRAK